MAGEKTYLDVLLPVKFDGTLTYSCIENEDAAVVPGSWVEVTLRSRRQIGVVTAVHGTAPAGIAEERVLPVSAVISRPPVRPGEIEFWKEIAGYYMCTTGEVFKAAYNSVIKLIPAQGTVKARPGKRRSKEKTVSPADRSSVSPAALSEAQADALSSIRESFGRRRHVLLNGVTGSGKTEIYMHLAKEQIDKGRQVLYLVPEIAVSKQLQQRLEAVFGDLLKVFHSKLTANARRDVTDTLASGSGPCIVLGTRSAVFLPFSNLGLVIVDEEHDQSYKQDDPAPRYNGRDAATMLAVRHGASLLLGSATPSYEAAYNVADGKFDEVVLSQRFHGSLPPSVKVIDTNRERRLRNMRGSFSASLLREMGGVLDAGGQILVFRSRRAYSPIVQCSECGDVPKCPKCNVSLSYHKYNNTLSCHYCGHSEVFTTRCKACGEPALVHKGAGTEKIEEDLQSLFPDRTVARFDADTTASKVREEKMIRDFATHRTDILVGTQMITKGFDFEKLDLVVLLNADSLFAVQDFRSDERARQLITQLTGRAGRRSTPGRIIIQTAQPDHPVLQQPGSVADGLAERKMFNYPPYVRMVRITVQDRNEGRLWNACRRIKEALAECGMKDAAGPVTPAVDVVDKFHIREFWVKLSRDRRQKQAKETLRARLDAIDRDFKGGTVIICDVDPQ